MSMSIRMRATVNSLTAVADNLRILHYASEIMNVSADAVKSAKVIATAAKKIENFAKKYDLDIEHMKGVYNDNPDPDYFIAAFIGTPEGLKVYKNVKTYSGSADTVNEGED